MNINKKEHKYITTKKYVNKKGKKLFIHITPLNIYRNIKNNTDWRKRYYVLYVDGHIKNIVSITILNVNIIYWHVRL